MASEGSAATTSNLENGGHKEEVPKQQQQPLEPAELQDEDQENDRDRIIAELTRANGILKANISTLYRTARAEIARKNDRIAELQASLDDLLFKRMNRQSRDFANASQLVFDAGASTSGIAATMGESSTGANAATRA